MHFMMNRIDPLNQLRFRGFTLLELLVVISIVLVGSSWVIPQYRRQLILSYLDRYSQQIESGLFSLRSRQSAEGTSCEISINPSLVGTDNTTSGFANPSEVLELNHLDSKERKERLNCCDATSCSWDPPYRLISQEGSRSSKEVEVKFSQEKYLISPPGMSTDSNPLIILVKASSKNDDPLRPLPIRCIKLSTAGHLHRGTWEKSQCRR
tara:strand:- start:1696 stop:2322 length:627 start_codon:yes stop_codon:yes gene_type:complete